MRNSKNMILQRIPIIKLMFKKQEGPVNKISDPNMIPDDHSAAIAMALYLYNDLHDQESNILTIERVSRLYSPWCSKYYNMRKPIR
jgi:glutaconyl-CoA/methylmalonyl-CoA decarboxylase subunit delta